MLGAEGEYPPSESRQTETNSHAETQARSRSTEELYNYANLLEELSIKGHHDETTLNKQEQLGFPVSSRDITPGNIASAFAILAQAREDLGENFQWDGSISTPWTRKMLKACLDLVESHSGNRSTMEVALLQKRKHYLEDLRGKISDPSQFPQDEDDPQAAAEDISHTFYRLQRIAQTYS